MTATQTPAHFIDLLGIDRAPSDTCKAKILNALIRFGLAINDAALIDAAKARLPAANPFEPPVEWKSFYDLAFRQHADEDCGVYPDDDGDRYCREYWQYLTDTERAERLQQPSLGKEDGKKDAEALNAA